MARPLHLHELLESLSSPGAFARREELISRWGRASLERSLASGALVRLAPGLYSARSCALSFATRVNVANAWMHERSAIGGVAALAIHGLADIRPQRIVVVSEAPNHTRAPAWVRVVRTRRPFQTVRRGGIRCQGREDAIVQAWTELPREQATSVILEALRRSRLSGDRVAEALASTPRVRDRRALAGLLAEASQGVQSYLEHRARRTVLNTADMRHLERQVQMRVGQSTFVLDTYERRSRTAIEFDGAEHHDTAEAFQRDRERDSALATIGILTLRFTYEDVMTRPLWVRERIRSALRARGGGAKVQQRAA